MSLSRIILDHPYPTLLTPLPNDVAMVILGELGVVRERFANVTYDPSAPVILVTLRLLCRESYAFMAMLGLPLLNALPYQATSITYKYEEPDSSSSSGDSDNEEKSTNGRYIRHAAGPVEPRPWWRCPDVARYVGRAGIRAAIFADPLFWKSIRQDYSLRDGTTNALLYEALPTDAIETSNTWVLQRFLATKPAIIHYYALQDTVIKRDSDEAFKCIHDASVGPVWLATNLNFYHFIKGNDVLQSVLVHGASAIFELYRNQAVQLRCEYPFLLACRRFVNQCVKKATTEPLPASHAQQRATLHAILNARIGILQRARHRSKGPGRMPDVEPPRGLKRTRSDASESQ